MKNGLKIRLEYVSAGLSQSFARELESTYQKICQNLSQTPKRLKSLNQRTEQQVQKSSHQMHSEVENYGETFTPRSNPLGENRANIGVFINLLGVNVFEFIVYVDSNTLSWYDRSGIR